MRTTRSSWQFDANGLFGAADVGPMDNIVGTEDDNFLGDTSGNDVIWGLGGNDTLLSTQGFDVLLGGSGDDQYLTSSASYTLIQDESGDDLAGLALANSDTGFTRLVVRDGAGDQIADLTWQSDRATIEAADAAGVRFDFMRWSGGSWNIQHQVEGVEHFQVTGSDSNDLLLARGSKGVAFDGRGGFDTFVANWSSATDDISWVNTPTLTQTVNGIQVAGVERLILRTGSGNDTIDNRGNGSSADDLITGAGNDWVAIDQGTVDTGSGDDTITQAWGSVDGGDDSDTLHMGGIYNSDTGITRLLAYDASNTLVGDLSTNSSRADIENALTSATQFDFTSWWSGGWRTQLHTANIEHWTVNGSNTADLIVARGDGDSYAGNGGFDSFYADWSGASSDISWVNTPASAQTVNGISVSGFERLILRTGSGNDTIDNRGNGSSADDLVTGAGNDWVAIDQGTVDTGSGDDTITQAWGSVDGGDDSDTLHMGGIYNSDTGITRLLAYDASNTLVGDLSTNSSRADIENALASATQFDFTSWWSGTWRTQLHTANIEHWTVNGSNTADLIIARGDGDSYAGNGGFDTFYANWSGASSDISWVNTPASTQTVNGISVSGFERLILRTGSGNDTIDNRGHGSSTDDLVTGAGNDWVAVDQGTVDTGDGDDTITQAWGSVDGGADSDTLAMGGVYNSDTGYTRLIAYDASNTLVGDLNYTSSRASIENALASATQFDFTSWWSSGWRTQLHAANIEHWTVNGSNTADLIVARGDGDSYAGNGGFDSFYADWSGASSAISWVNTPASTQTVNGISVSGFERLILRTGSGNDTIDNRGNGSSTDDLVTGAGNDWVAVDQGTVDTGSGDDTITQSWGSVDGGDDSDTLTIGSLYNSDTGYTRLLAYDAGGALLGDLNYGSSRGDIENALASATQFDFVRWSSGWQTQLHAANIEQWSITGSATNDLIVARGQGGSYAGNGGFDSFYADWSGASSGISWVNTPATTQTVNGTSVSGFERLILRTGSGNDTIDNRGNGSSTDDLVTGAGNDWVAVDQGTVDTGSGNDTITQAWGSVDGGADTDTLTIGSLANSDTGYTRLLAYDAGGALLGDLNYGSSRAAIAAALAGATQFDFVRWSSGWQTQLHVANVEQWSITGSATNDLIVARGQGGSYHGGGGIDTFYADWSTSTSAVILGSTELPNSVQWSGFERSLITGSVWRDQLDLSANSGSDDVMAGAGNDTISGIGAGDTVTGGTGSDVYQVTASGAVLVEDAGGGIDEVWSTVNFTLGDNFESLRLQGSAALEGTGNARANEISGNVGDNLLRGMAGNDLLLGNAGLDQLNGGAGADTLRGGADNDRLVGGAGVDQFVLEASAAANGLDKVLDLQAGIGGDVVDLSAFFGPAGATALDGNPGGGTSLDALAPPLTLSGQHLFAVAGDFGADGPSAKELATLLQGTRVDDGSHQVILVQDLLSGQGHLFFVEERTGDGNNRLQASELHEVAQLTLEGGLPSSALWAENFLLPAIGG
ncbi:beta strand repeat-containing protein [Ideonella alba]|uniref:Uncharacterized protein n=1 Tax=Ideonella alba TaxID=2824118 RepID=A0A941BJV1_9BURK|nr:calcium-binding protein [Ideonella alba]MBQ0929479.1 hypothetical protein [Ideonella alba]